MSVRLERRARMLSGVPRTPDPNRSVARRILTSPWTWATVVMLVLGALALWHMYDTFHSDKTYPEGVAPGIPNESIKLAAKWAVPTAAVYTLLFLWLDRFRKNRILMWVFAFIWGACFSTWLSLQVNTWAGSLLNVSGNDPSSGSRPAVFVAPFVEEAAKATILFALAILVRYRIVSMLQSVCLAGLSAVGFAFTENIIYYARAHNYATQQINVGDPEKAMLELVKLRGIYTSFGHPFFTTFIGIGLVIGLRARSKLVRVLAPVTGFCVASLGHMAFNGTASSPMPQRQLIMVWLMALAMVAMLIGFLVRKLFAEGGRIRARLTDLARMGWLLPTDPVIYASLWRRLRVLLIAFSQPQRLGATITVMRDMTELAYLRDSMVLGLIDEVGYERSRELLSEIRALRPVAVSDLAGERFRWPNLGRLIPSRRRAAVGPTYGPPNNQWGPPAPR